LKLHFGDCGELQLSFAFPSDPTVHTSASAAGTAAREIHKTLIGTNILDKNARMFVPRNLSPENKRQRLEEIPRWSRSPFAYLPLRTASQPLEYDPIFAGDV
jgi:hypothetical protein